MINKLSDTKKNVFSVFLIAILAIIIYSNSFYASFHFDDSHAIVENYAIHRFDLKEIFSTSSRPFLDMTFALNYYFGKLNVFGYHLVNLVLHIANGVMLYFILFWTINPPHPNPSPQGGRAGEGMLPLYASLIFIAHPIQTQAVTYIVSRSSVLATTFYLLALLLFIRAFRQNTVTEANKKPNDVTLRRNGLRNPNRSTKFYLLGAFLSSCLGMGTKQEAATLPLILLIYDFYFISKGDWKALKSHYKIYLIMFSTVLIAVYLSFSGLNMFVSFDYAKGIPMPQAEPITSFQYFLTQLHVIPYYIRLLFIPANLNLDYDWPITRNIDSSIIFFFALLASIIIVAIWLFRRARLISFGIIWFFVTLSVTSSFIVIYDVIFEHRLYLPSIGFAIVIAFMISKISALKNSKAMSKKLLTEETSNNKGGMGGLLLYVLCSMLLAFSLLLLIPHKLYAQPQGPLVTYLDSINSDEEGGKISFPFAVFADPVKNEIYVVDTWDRIIIYTSDFFPLFTLSKRNGVESPQGLTVDAKGNLYVAQSVTKDNPKPRISVFNACLKWERDFYLEGFEGAGEFIPYRLAKDKKGNIYVAGLHFPGVLVLNSNDKLIEILSPEEDERKVKLTNVTIDKLGRIYLISEEESHIYVYDENRKFLFRFGEKGGGSGKLSRPQALSVDNRNGRIYVVDYMRHTISVYDKDGKYLFEFGGLGWGEGWFQHPRDISIDPAGRIFIADTFNDRIEVFQAGE